MWGLQCILAWGPACAASGQRLMPSLCQRMGLVTNPSSAHPLMGWCSICGGWPAMGPLLAPCSAQLWCSTAHVAPWQPQPPCREEQPYVVAALLRQAYVVQLSQHEVFDLLLCDAYLSWLYAAVIKYNFLSVLFKKTDFCLPCRMT